MDIDEEEDNERTNNEMKMEREESIQERPRRRTTRLARGEGFYEEVNDEDVFENWMLSYLEEDLFSRS